MYPYGCKLKIWPLLELYTPNTFMIYPRKRILLLDFWFITFRLPILLCHVSLLPVKLSGWSWPLGINMLKLDVFQALLRYNFWVETQGNPKSGWVSFSLQLTEPPSLLGLYGFSTLGIFMWETQGLTLTLPMLSLLSSKAQWRKVFWKPSNPVMLVFVG